MREWKRGGALVDGNDMNLGTMGPHIGWGLEELGNNGGLAEAKAHSWPNGTKGSYYDTPVASSQSPGDHQRALGHGANLAPTLAPTVRN